MLPLAALAVVLAAAPLKVGVTGLSYAGLDPKEGDALIDFFADRLGSASGLNIVTQSQVSGLLGFERQRALLGCADAGIACMAELAGAMGIDLLLTGSLAKVDGGFTVSMKLVNVHTSVPRFSAATRVRNADALSSWFEGVASDWGRQLHSGSTSAIGVGTWLLGGAAVLLGAGAGIFFGLSQSEALRLRTPGSFTSAGALKSAAAWGDTSQTLGWVFVGLTSAAVVGAVLSVLIGRQVEPVTLWLTSDGAGVAVRGAFP